MSHTFPHFNSICELGRVSWTLRYGERPEKYGTARDRRTSRLRLTPDEKILIKGNAKDRSLRETRDVDGQSTILQCRLPRTDFRPSVHLRPHFYIFNGLSPEFVHEVDGLSPHFGLLFTWTDGRSADGRLRPWRPAPMDP